MTAEGAYALGTASLDVVEPGSVHGTPSRVLPTTVWYPAPGGTTGSTPDHARAPYPLLVFSQGYDIPVAAYQPLLEAVASAGFVVAAPKYPHTDPSDPAAVDENDVVNHPADLRAVLTRVLATARQPGQVLFGLVDAAEVGVIGHSDGGDVSLAVAENSCCNDPRVRAAVILSGAELSTFGGRYFANGGVPLLVVQGTADTINLPACSAQAYDEAPPPKDYLDLLGAGHEPPYRDAGTYREVVVRVVTDFADVTLAHEHAAAGAMVTDGNVPGVAQITQAQSAPPSAGRCPGAPG